MKKNYAILLILLALLFCGHTAKAQQPILQRKISVDVQALPLDKTLDVIAQKGNFHFSYSSALIKRDSLISLRVTDQPVQQILTTLFRDNLVFKESGNHLILTASPKKAMPVTSAKTKNNSGYVVTGYVTDLSTGERVAYASVYDTASMSSSYSDSSGFFKLIIKNKQTTPTIAISKKDYLDTVIVVEPIRLQNVNIGLSPEPQKAPVAMAINAIPGQEPLMQSKNWMRYTTSFRQRLAAMNIEDLTGLRYSQVSFIPGFGTSGALSSTMTYRFSLNVIGGYTGGIDGVEIGSVFNLNRNNVKGVQIAGFGNAVGGNTSGFQAAGFMNLNYGKTAGIQAAGFMNLGRDTISGGQLAGFMNLSYKNAGGFQGAGFMNVAVKSSKLIQASGFLNLADSAIVQVTGFVNVARDAGPQAAGFVNVAKNAKGVQVAGFINVAQDVKGAQVAGFINVAKKVKGAQIGFINVADSMNGVAVGFLSFIKNGLHEFEISSNETVAINVAYRTGMTQFYNIITAGVHPVKGEYVLSLGYGIGHRFVLGEKSGLDLELLANQIFLGKWNQDNTHGRLQLSYNFKPAKHFSFFAGASYNVNVFEITPFPEPFYAGQISPWVNQTFDERNYRVNFWPGFQAGIRLF